MASPIQEFDEIEEFDDAPLTPAAEPASDDVRREMLQSYYDQTNPEILRTPKPLRQNPEVVGVAGGNLPQPTGHAAEVLSSPSATAMLPVTVLGKGINAAASDLGMTLGVGLESLHELDPSVLGEIENQGGNIKSFFRDPLETTPQQRVLRDISKEHPVLATTGKVAGSLIESSPMLALMPEATLGKLVSAGFTIDMLAGAPEAGTALGEELGKPPEERDYDKITSALSSIAQTAAFAPMSAVHAGGKTIGERVRPKDEVIRELAKTLQNGEMNPPRAFVPTHLREIGKPNVPPPIQEFNERGEGITGPVQTLETKTNEGKITPAGEVQVTPPASSNQPGVGEGGATGERVLSGEPAGSVQGVQSGPTTVIGVEAVDGGFAITRNGVRSDGTFSSRKVAEETAASLREIIANADKASAERAKANQPSPASKPAATVTPTEAPQVTPAVTPPAAEAGAVPPVIPIQKAAPGEVPPVLPEGEQEIIGMGGARPSEFGSPVKYTTSNKNATVDAERKQRGLPPMMETARKGNQEAWDEAMQRIDASDGAQDQLISELVANPRALDPVENAMVLHRRIYLRNEYEKALNRWRQMWEANDPVRAADESQLVKRFSEQLADLENVTKATGAESGRSLQARKMMAREDYSLAKMELSAMEAKGRHLTPEEHIELIRAHEKIKALEDKITELESAREGKEVERDVAATLDEVEAAAKKEPKGKSETGELDADAEAKVMGSLRAKFEKGKVDEITPLIQKLAKFFWKRGVREREPMIDALHGALQTIDPDFTRDQTKRAFSGYGDFTPLSKDEMSVGLRDLRGQTQQVLKVEALEARKPLEKTGQERRIPSDEERRLIKQVNELKRKYGVVVTDPATQLKSALQSRKTYYEHRLTDLKHEIATRERIVKTKSPSPTDPELEALKAEYDRVKEEHEAIFPKQEITDEQRLKMAMAAAERNLAHWQVRLENAQKGSFGILKKGGKKVTSAELENLKAQTEAVKEHIQELKDLDEALAAQKREASIAREKANLEKDIAEQERKLREGDLAGPGKKMNRPADPELEALKQKRDALNKQMAEARKKPEAQKEAEARQRQLDGYNKQIAEREAKIAAGDLSSDAAPKKQNRPLPPELEQAKQRLEAVNKELADLRKAARPTKTPEEIALQSLKTRMKNRAAELTDRMARGDFAKKERKPVTLDVEGNKLKAELDKIKSEYEKKLEQDRWSKMSVFQKGKRKTADIYDTARAIMTTGELSFILRQAKMVAASHPIQTAKALPDMFRALIGNEQKAREIDLAVHNHPDAPAARAAKLAITEEGAPLTRQEEILMGRMVGKIPIVKNFNQAGHVFLNRIRFDTWRAMRKSLTKSGTPTPLEDRQIAMFVNEATGRGSLPGFEGSAVPLGRAFFSPRYYMSRLQLASGHSMWGGTMRTRRIIATEYAKSLIGLGLYYSLLSAAFSRGGTEQDKNKGSIEMDPRSNEFGMVKVGNTRVDPLAGLSQVITLAARTYTGEKKTRSGKIVPIRGDDVPYGGQRWTDVYAAHVRGKLHPVPAAIANLFNGTDLSGDNATVANQAGNMALPITYIDIYQALKDQDLPDGAALSLLAILGEGMRTYQKQNKNKKSAAGLPTTD